MNILCALGIHNWSNWWLVQIQLEYAFIKHKTVSDAQERMCEKCGKIQRVEL